MFFFFYFGTEHCVHLWETVTIFQGGTMRKEKANENKNFLIWLKDTKSLFESFACAKKAEALQQIST